MKNNYLLADGHKNVSLVNGFKLISCSTTLCKKERPVNER